MEGGEEKVWGGLFTGNCKFLQMKSPQQLTNSKADAAIQGWNWDGGLIKVSTKARTIKGLWLGWTRLS